MPPVLLRRLSSQPKSGTEPKEGGHRMDKRLPDWPLPSLHKDADEEDEAELMSEQSPNPEADFPDEPLEEGNRIWATRLFPQAEHICVTATVSQRLAEGFRQNSQPVDHEKHILPHLCDFLSVFSKDSFDELPGTKPWDHAVELTPDATPKSCKVYPLSASEQKRVRCLPEGKPRIWTDLTLQIPDGRSSLLCKKEGQEIPSGTGLPHAEHHDHEEQVPTSPNSRADCEAPRSQVLVRATAVGRAQSGMWY